MYAGCPVYFFLVFIQSLLEIANYYINFGEILLLTRHFIDIIQFGISVYIASVFYNNLGPSHHVKISYLIYDYQESTVNEIIIPLGINFALTFYKMADYLKIQKKFGLLI
jgi:hypothetical protein